MEDLWTAPVEEWAPAGEFDGVIDQIIMLMSQLPNELQMELFAILQEQFNAVQADEAGEAAQSADTEIAAQMASMVA